MPSWEGKSKGTKLGYSIFIGILKRFGVFPAYLLLLSVAMYYLFFSIQSTKNSYSFFQKRMKFSKIKSVIHCYMNYLYFGQSMIDKMALISGFKNSFTFEFNGEENLKIMIKNKKGGILLSGHIGNWDAAGFLLQRLDTRINIVIFDGEHRQIKDYLEKVSGPRKMNIIVIKNNLSHVYEINEALNRNELVCMHADRFLDGNRTRKMNFLGAEARFPEGPFLLASTFKVPVSFVFAVKKGLTHYQLSSTKLKTYQEGSRQENIQVMMQDFVTVFEEKVNKSPNQWFNYYNFWKA